MEAGPGYDRDGHDRRDAAVAPCVFFESGEETDTTTKPSV